VALPKSEGYTQIMVVVDCFSKMAHFIALAKTATSKDAAQVFLKEV
jgi:small neutral amino acid transporter SnatA (MarC family)